ncbi:MAG: hypothetical protein GJ676_09295 [Rhodobacteraceae bacterium]|nr:hypothetical protein [Paracoccaceae bacterium]
MQREVAETGVSKQYSDPTVAVSTVLPGQLDHVSHWFVLIFSALRDTSLLGSMLPKHPTGAALSNIKLAADMIDADTTTSGAQGLRPFRFETV